MQRKKETEVSELEKQKFYEKRKHGTPRFPMECFVTRADGNQHFLVPLHWHRNYANAAWYSGNYNWK